MEYGGKFRTISMGGGLGLTVTPQTGLPIRSLEAHTEVVTSLVWLPDGTGFISGGLDKKIIFWVCSFVLLPFSYSVGRGC